MAQDYHIYIHDSNGASGNGSGNQTTPFSAKSSDDESFRTAVQKPYSIAKGIASGNGVNMGVAALTKVAPWVAVAAAAINITDKVLTIGFSHVTEYTGNYDLEVGYNNFKTSFYNSLHPIKFWLSIKHQDAQFRKQNKQINEQNKLIGNSILKDFNIGV